MSTSSGRLRDKLDPGMRDATEYLMKEMGGRILYMQIGDQSWGNNPSPEFSVDLLAEHLDRQKDIAAKKFFKDLRARELKKNKK